MAPKKSPATPPESPIFTPFPGERFEHVTFHVKRDPVVPKLVKLKIWHPRLPISLEGIVQRIFVYTTDISPAYMKLFNKYAEEHLNIHEGPDSEMLDSGEIQFCAGDVVFARALNAAGPMADRLQLFLVRADQQIPEDVLNSLHELRKECLGPFDTRDPVNGMTRLENDARWASVQGGRCVSMGLNVQRPKSVANPAASGKSNANDSVDWGLKIRGEVNTQFTAVGNQILEAFDPTTYEILKRNAELKNLPRVGADNNCAFSGVQVNLASSVSWESREGLKKQMKDFGGKHRDKNDAGGGVTLFFVYTDVPRAEGYEGGRFHFPELGGYVILDAFLVIGFSGLRHHGGTPSRAPKGGEPDPRHTRLAVVLYPPRTVANGSAVYSLFAGGRNEVIRHVPEYADIHAEKNKLRTHVMTFAEDGPHIMSQGNLMNFIGRGVLQMVTSHLRQLPDEWAVDIDPNAFLQAITFRPKGTAQADERQSLEPWAWAPRVRSEDSANIEPALRSERQLAHEQWETHCTDVARYIPYLAQSLPALEPLPNAIAPTPNPTRLPSQSKVGQGSQQLTKKGYPKGNKRVYDRSTDARMTSKAVDKATNEGMRYLAKRKRSTIVEEDDDMSEHEVSVVLNHRKKQKGNTESVEYNVRWAGYSSEDDSWVPLNEIIGTADELLDMYNQKAGISVTQNGHVYFKDNMELPRSDDDTLDMSHTLLRLASPSLDEEHSEDYLFDEDEEMEDTECILSTSMTDIPFLRDLTSHAVRKALLHFAQACRAIENLPHGHQSGSFLQRFASLHQAFNKDSTKLSTLEDIYRMWPQTNLLVQDTDIQVATLVLQRQLIMWTRYLIRHWIHHHIVDGTSVSPWLKVIIGKISSSVNEWMSVEKSVIEFTSTDLPFIDPPRVYKYHRNLPTSRGWKLSLEQKQSRIINDTLKVVEAWFGLPEGDLADAQRRFLDMLAESVPEATLRGLLLLPVIAAAYDDPLNELASTRKQGKRRIKRMDDSDWKDLKNGWQTHPFIHDLSNPSSLPSRLLSRLQEVSDQFIAVNQVPVAPRRPSAGTQINGAPYQPATALLMDPVVEFLRELLPWIDEAEDRDPSQLYSKVSEDPDKRLPFRECAPSRAHLFQTDIFKDPCPTDILPVVRSLLIHRGITFNTKKVHTHPGLFRTRQDWFDFRGEGGADDEALYCNKGAYGQPNARSTENFDIFWRAAVPISNFLTTEGFPPTFEDTIHFLRDEKRNGFSLPALGPLGTFLLAEDLVYSKLVEMPRAENFAANVADLSMGAADALVKLKITKEKDTKQNIAVAFLHLYQYLDSVFTQAEKDVMMFDIFMVEHALCKMKRCQHWHSYFD